MRVLLIQDEPATANAIELMLISEGFNVYPTDLSEDVAALRKPLDCDIILLDLNRPDTHGGNGLKMLRVTKGLTPVLVLSDAAFTAPQIRSFGFWADDYLTKPFNRDELVARINALVPRFKERSQSVILTGKLVVDLDAKSLTIDGASVHLNCKEYAMLELLSLRKGTTVTKEMFLNHLYGGINEPEAKMVDVYIYKLRKKMSYACAGEDYIETVWGRGYVLRDTQESTQVTW